jgi:hypothetical protein
MRHLWRIEAAIVLAAVAATALVYDFLIPKYFSGQPTVWPFLVALGLVAIATAFAVRRRPDESAKMMVFRVCVHMTATVALTAFLSLVSIISVRGS